MFMVAGRFSEGQTGGRTSPLAGHESLRRSPGPCSTTAVVRDEHACLSMSEQHVKTTESFASLQSRGRKKKGLSHL